MKLGDTQSALKWLPITVSPKAIPVELLRSLKQKTKRRFKMNIQTTTNFKPGEMFENSSFISSRC